MIPVQSSNISAIGEWQPLNNDPDNPVGSVLVAFKSGNSGTYMNVPKQTYDLWLTAESKGKFHAQVIKPQFQYVKS